MPETNISQAIEAANDAGAAYDTNAKYLLSDKQVLARILKYAVQEFKDMPIPGIIKGIGDEIEISSRAVEPGLSNSGRVKGSDTEDNVPGEGKIYYDICFQAYHLEREMKFLINVEAQKTADPKKLGYHLENRILFYLARMVSAQKQREFFHSDYDNIKRVRSIWICMGQGTEGRNGEGAIEEIGLCRKAIVGQEPSQYGMDLMKAIVIKIQSGEGRKGSRHKLMGMLETLFGQGPAEEKKRELTEKYGMEMTIEMERRIQVMCNLSENIKAEGIKKGMEKGIKTGMKKGIKKGIETERQAAIERMMRAGATKEQIISYGYRQEEYEDVEKALLVKG